MARSLWPKKLEIIRATSVAAAAFSRLLPRRITPSNRSVSANNLVVRPAPRCPCLTRNFNRYRLIAIMLVSEREKNADRINKIATAISSTYNGKSSKKSSYLNREEFSIEGRRSFVKDSRVEICELIRSIISIRCSILF